MVGDWSQSQPIAPLSLYFALDLTMTAGMSDREPFVNAGRSPRIVSSSFFNCALIFATILEHSVSLVGRSRVRAPYHSCEPASLFVQADRIVHAGPGCSDSLFDKALLHRGQLAFSDLASSAIALPLAVLSSECDVIYLLRASQLKIGSLVSLNLSRIFKIIELFCEVA